MFIELNNQLTGIREKLRIRQKIEHNLTSVKRSLNRELLRLKQLEAELYQESEDVERLEELTLTGLFYTILGSKEQQIEKERQEQLTAKLKYDQCRFAVTSLEQEFSRLIQELNNFQNLDEQYKALLDEKERLLLESDKGSAERLANLSEKITELRSDLRELQEAATAGEALKMKLSEVVNSLKSAEGWGTFDLLGGGLLATAAKHGDINKARTQVHQSQELLRRFQQELSDVEIDTHFGIELGEFEVFADYFFDGLIIDWVVQSKIQTSLARTIQTVNKVKKVVASLQQQSNKVEQQIEELQKEYKSTIEHA